jgi:uncharacterized protein (DUF1778 family)
MPGRPKKAKSDSKTYMLRIRMTEEDRELIDAAARAKSLESSTWARSELIALAKKILAKR